ncbi:hypothetical protein NUI41_003585 [Salmonella enterica subsp. enterica serovar Newport]|uniref:Uncharacterized protein n=1 Tax=Salmonella enterica subsp. enterica serovar Give TaxID=46626 RepID=A0A8E7KFG6_SALET|nr:hypothetical protein [Salmonella enterica]EBU8924848.1 hypothetical protein [Salmonella enterica subsp. enterica serovar Nima]EDS7029662.1 hypothetical protein [Salmonella enterica subsp. enterica]EEO8334560.1 hypothetical protein [Salmonella enterica subsp. enterica serovar Newport]EEP8237722.1 hypothetical protein [Salmonella enterica subsp. enterica serovar Chester]EIR7526204.1 hypothetical protein [Salmonella enterica subsp. enterica serovar Brandenburg]
MNEYLRQTGAFNPVCSYGRRLVCGVVHASPVAELLLTADDWRITKKSLYGSDEPSYAFFPTEIIPLLLSIRQWLVAVV